METLLNYLILTSAHKLYPIADQKWLKCQPEMLNLFQTKGLETVLISSYPPRERRKTKNKHLTYCRSENTTKKLLKQCGFGFDDNIGGSTDLEKKWRGRADLYTPIYPPLSSTLVIPTT